MTGCSVLVWDVELLVPAWTLRQEAKSRNFACVPPPPPPSGLSDQPHRRSALGRPGLLSQEHDDVPSLAEMPRLGGRFPNLKRNQETEPEGCIRGQAQTSKNIQVWPFRGTAACGGVPIAPHPINVIALASEGLLERGSIDNLDERGYNRCTCGWNISDFRQQYHRGQQPVTPRRHLDNGAPLFRARTTQLAQELSTTFWRVAQRQRQPSKFCILRPRHHAPWWNGSSTLTTSGFG